MEKDSLAERIVEERRSVAGRRQGVPWYMMNINHPAIRAMYEEWRATQGPDWAAPGDVARTRFELEMMAPRALEMLEQHFALVDRLKGVGR